MDNTTDRDAKKSTMDIPVWGYIWMVAFVVVMLSIFGIRWYLRTHRHGSGMKGGCPAALCLAPLLLL